MIFWYNFLIFLILQPDINEFILLLLKGVYPYEYMDGKLLILLDSYISIIIEYQKIKTY